jgi:hypothetical protein
VLGAALVADCSAFVFASVAGVVVLFDFLSDFGVMAGVIAGA